MVLKKASAHLVGFKVDNADWTGEYEAQTKYLYRLVPNQNTYLAFQVVSETDIDFQNGNSVAFQAQVVYVLDYQKPMLMQLLTLAENAVEQLNLLFDFTVTPKRYMSNIKIEKFKEETAIVDISNEIEKLFK